MNNGWIKIYRKIADNPIWKNSQLVHLFLTLLLNANHETKEVLFNGKIEVVGRGQLITGRFSLSTETGIPASSIRNYLKILQNIKIVDIKPNNKFSLITILKYSQYQDKGQPEDSKQDNQRTSTGQPEDTNKKNKNIRIKEIKNIVAKPPNEINLLLDFFKKTVNPHIGFNNKTERKACSDLLKAYGLEKIKQSMAFLEEKRKTDKYLPIITTPYELWTKWAKIKQHLEIQKVEKKGHLIL